MPNDLSTLSGALLEMKDQLIYELGQKGVTAQYDSTTGLLGLIGEISNIQQGGSCYHIELDSSAYTTSGALTVTAYLQENYQPKANAVVTFTGGTSTVTATTDSSGVATATVTFSQSGTLTATYSNVSDTATVTYSQYLFYDGCSADNTSQYTDIFRYRYSTVVPTLTYSNNTYTFDASSRSDTFCGYVLPNLNGKNNIKIKAKVRLNSSSAYCQIGLGFSDSLQVNYQGAFTFYRIRGNKLIDWVEGESNSTWHSNAVQPNTDYYIELLRESAKCTFNVYDSNNTLLYSDYRNTNNTYSNPYFYIARNMRNTGTSSTIYEIKAEYI